jgi:hypothetical protein
VSYGEKLVCDRKKQEKVNKCSKFCRVIPFMGSIVDGVGNYSSLQHTTNDSLWFDLIGDQTHNLSSQGTLDSYTNKTDCHDIIEILLKVVLNTQ